MQVAHGRVPADEKAHFKLNLDSFDLSSSDHRIEGHAQSEHIGLLFESEMPVLYFGLLTRAGRGRTPGKWLLGVRVVSIVHPHLTLWHAVERALGYGAALLEGGFGFVQFFIHPYRRCAQDRLAETIVGDGAELAGVCGSQT